jgi:hypothetical protein
MRMLRCTFHGKFLALLLGLGCIFIASCDDQNESRYGVDATITPATQEPDDEEESRP